jgi:NADPH:quinone reductase-like Zn-dependent oxidoreductase
LDTVGATRFGECKSALTANGVFLPLEFGLREIWQALVTSMRHGKKVIVNVSGDSAKDMDYLSDLLERGEIRPVIDVVYPLDQIAEAHARVEGRHKTGAVVVSVSNAITLGLAAE